MKRNRPVHIISLFSWKLQTIRLFMLWLPLLLSPVAMAEDKTCPVVKLPMERLPDMNVPRGGHALFCINGELTVIGGHTTGFVITQSAEYFADGKWHPMNPVYAHDDGAYKVLRSGKVLLYGGHERNLGIGQSYEVEMYDPVTHTFRGFGCLDQKRSLSSSEELNDGRIVISGNWYHDDGIEVFDGKNTFSFVKNVSQTRTTPYILLTAADNVMILSNLDTKGNSIDTVIVDQLKGDPFEVPLLKKWKLTGYINTTNMSNCFIGDISKDDYSYLLPVMNSETQMAVTKTKGTDFSLLPTLCPIPMESQWGPIYYNTQFLIDHKARRAYIIGSGPNIEKKQEKGYRLYVLGIDYDHLENGKAPLILYYSDVMTEVPSGPSTITEEGNIVLAGGIPKGSNFTPTAAVYLLHTGTKPTATSYRNFSLWIGSAVVVLLLCIVGLVMKRQKKIAHIDTESPLPYTVKPTRKNSRFTRPMKN